MNDNRLAVTTYLRLATKLTDSAEVTDLIAGRMANIAMVIDPNMKLHWVVSREHALRARADRLEAAALLREAARLS